MLNVDNKDIQLLMKAVDFAARKHQHQRRKGEDKLPYINHPIEVANLISSHGITDINVLIPALLHDVIEDTDTSAEEVAEQFSDKISQVVLEVSDNQALCKADRKQAQIDHSPHISLEAKWVKLADKISNAGSIVHTPPSGWELARKLEYINWCKAVVAALGLPEHDLVRLFDKTAADALAHFQ
jgi:GTP diphosphokinase / guanosine-3',5'-bis(diphosphate) 3'-diphosphatase